MLKRLSFLAAVVAALAIAACGGSSGSSTSKAGASSATTSSSAPAATSSASAPASGGAPASGSATLKLAAPKSGALAFDKKTLSAKAGKVTIAFANPSPLPHNVTVQKGTNGPTIAATPTFSGGTKSVTMTLKPGKYTYYCSVPGHRQGGMLGTLTVTG